MNSSLQDHHINATVKLATERGYHCVLVNPVRPDLKKDICDLECIDYSRVEPVSESIEVIKSMFGNDSEIYAIGYSLGSNHLMRHLGAHKDCKDICGIRAAVSISGAYDLRATTVTIQHRVLGMYDYYILHQLQESFSKGKFRATSQDPDLFHKKAYQAKNMTEFDTLIRGPIFGYRGASRLFRHISCDVFIPQIETPLFALTAKDDSITDYDFVPIDDLKRNPNIILAVVERGGHCNLFF